jgi:dihydropyrimidinase
MGSDYSPYEGIEVQGYPSTTILRGNIIVENGQFLGEKGFGQFIRRKQPQYV